MLLNKVLYIKYKIYARREPTYCFELKNNQPFSIQLTTCQLYQQCGVLTVRQLFIRAVIIKQYSLVNRCHIEGNVLQRRKDKIFNMKVARK